MSSKFEPIAVVGVSALFPGSIDKTGFWTDILAGKDLLKEIPESHWLIQDYYDPDMTKPPVEPAASGRADDGQATGRGVRSISASSPSAPPRRRRSGSSSRSRMRRPRSGCSL